MRNRQTIGMLLIAAGIGMCVWAIYPPGEKIKRGLDLQGGVHVVLEVQKATDEAHTLTDLTDRALEVIRNRVDALRVSEPIIQREGDNFIIVDLPGAKDPEKALEIIGKTALLEFRLVKDDTSGDTSGYEFLPTRERDERGILRDGPPLLVKKEPELTGAGLRDAYVGYDAAKPVVNLELNREGARIFDEVTGRNVGRRLAIVLDGVVKSAPVIRTRIPDGKAQISGHFTVEEAKELALVLRAGALPAEVKLAYKEVVGPTLGKSYVEAGLRASLIGGAIVFAMMAVYYLWFGLLADFAMAFNILILIAVFSVIKGVFTLPGIAGIALAAGMAVDANILIFERMREEKRAGKSVRGIVDAGYHRAWSAIIDSNITTVIAGFALFMFGEGPIKGFGLTLCIGNIANLITAVFVTKVIVDWVLSNWRVETIRI